ncbi:MAG: glycosyltransferase [Myxococcales bacterium]
MDLPFTGERVIPGKVDADLWAEHLSRYLFAEPLAAGRRVLDLGAGAGYGSERLSKSAKSVVAMDIAYDAMRYAREHHPGRGVRHAVGAAEKLPFAKGSFDLVVAFEILEHIRDQDALLAEVRRVLAPDGLFVVSTPNRLYYTDERDEHNEFHVHELDVPELQQYLALAFSQVKIFVQNHAPAIVIGEAGREGLDRARAARPRAEPTAETYRACHYAIAVCGPQVPQLDSMVFFPEAQGNVLREREKHVKVLQKDLASAETSLRELRSDWERRGAANQELEVELRRSQEDYRRVEKDWQDRTEWAKRASAEADQLRAELEQTQQRERALRAQLEQASLGGGIRIAFKRARNSTFAATMAAVAVPVGLGLGAAALAAGAVARLRPRRRLEPAKVAGPRLASIQILNYEGRELLGRNLPSVLAAVAHTGQPHEVVVVDNGSTDGSVEMLREKFPQVTVVPLDRNYFFSRGNDLGVPHAKNGIIVLLNNDMRVEPDFLPPLLAPFDDPDVFAVSSQIFFANKTARREETGLTRARFVDGMLEYSHDALPERPGKMIPILWGGGGSCAFDRRKWEELGGLDTMYDPFYCEDLDLSLRAWRRGWKAVLAPESKVWHEHRATSRRFFGEDFVNEIARRNSYLLHWKNLDLFGMLPSHLLRLPFLVARDVRRHGRSGARSFAKAVKHAPEALLSRSREPSGGPSMRAVLRDTDSAAPAILFRGRKDLRESGPLRITMVTPYDFWPIRHGGAVRMYNVVRELSRRGHEVSVAGFVDSDEQLAAARELESFCSEVRLIKRRPNPPGLKERLGSRPAEVTEFDQIELHRELNTLIARHDPDVIQVEYTQMAPYARATDRSILCLTEHDVAFMSVYRHALTKTEFGDRTHEYARYLKMFRYELEALRRFDVVFAVTPRDAKILSGYVNGAVRVSDAAPTGVDVERLKKIERAPLPASLLFVGFLSHTPNVDAILHFAREILPRIHQQVPEATLTIVGANPPEVVRRLAGDPRITVTGFVPDLAPYYAKATAFVSPIRVAAGVRVKLMEAFAAGVPVVSSVQGGEGLDVEDRRELLLADSPEAFAEKTVALLRSPSGQMTARARAFVERCYSWPAIVAALETEYRTALRRKLGRN